MLSKASTSVINYGLDWSKRYPSDSISSYTVSVASGGISVTKISSSGMQTLFQVTGGTSTQLAGVLVSVVLGSGQTDQYLFPLYIE